MVSDFIKKAMPLVDSMISSVKDRLFSIQKNEKYLESINEIPSLTKESLVELERRENFDETLASVL